MRVENSSLHLYWLNAGSKVSDWQDKVLDELIDTFKKNITALEVGSPYGGAVEFMATKLKGKGKAYAYDTFEGHPKELADDQNSPEATCMDYWYREDVIGRERLDYAYQRKVLDQFGLDNAILVKGMVNEHSFDDIEKIHFIMLDLDLIKPTRVAYEAIKDKIVKGGYLFFHDATSPDHLRFIYEFVYNEVIPSGLWEVINADEESTLVILKKK